MNSNFYSSPAISRDVKIEPGTAKVVGSSLFFFKVEVFLTKNCRPVVCLLMFCRLSCHTVELVFFVRNFRSSCFQCFELLLQF